MSDWASGYRTDIDYTYGYYPELNPLRARLALLFQGFACPKFTNACELGFGQGLSVNLHAAASTTLWHGTDFNPTQASFAQELATASGAGAGLFDQSFEEFCSRPDLPDFDYIGLHGIWSWISDANRKLIVEFIRNKLKAGGVLYMSYNTLPGWAAFEPMRHLMREHSEVLGAPGHGILQRMDWAMDFAEKLLATRPAFLRAIPSAAERLKKMQALNRNYVAHEYFNEHFYPMHFATMAKWLDPAKVQYACSASYLDHVDALHLTAEQQAFIAGIPDPMFRQSVRDLMVNQQFRRDYWVKGARKLSSLEQAEALEAQRVILVSSRPDVALKAAGSLGEVALKEEIYGPLLDLMADHTPRSLGEIMAALKPTGLGFSQIIQSVMILVGAGHLAPAQSAEEVAAAAITGAAINTCLQERARGNSSIAVLASPVVGGGVEVARFHQLFLKAAKLGLKTPDEWAKYCWDVLARQGHRILKDGKTLADAEQNLAELTAQARAFAEKQLPILKALRVEG